MIEINKYQNITVSSEKNFGIVFGSVFSIIFFYQYFFYNKSILSLVIIAIIFLSFSFIYPKIFKIPNKLWHKLGLFLGAIVAPLVMALVFFSTVVPIGLIMKILRKDILNQKIVKSKKSYWKKNFNYDINFKNQF